MTEAALSGGGRLRPLLLGCTAPGNAL